MLHYKDPKVVKCLFKYGLGIEKESIRILGNGSFASTPHPLPSNKHIVRDFCENQIEINTGVSSSEEAVIRELESHEHYVRAALSNLPEKEYLWPFSNPPYITNEDDIPIAEFTGSHYDKTVYRKYLSEKYGKYKMTFCGIHVNFSFGEELVNAAYRASGSSDSLSNFRDRLYLDLASNLVSDAWIINVLLSASPVLDGSFIEKGVKGKTVFQGLASVRCSELGYWNHFVPFLDYENIITYTDSIKKYIDEGLIISQSELYYPIRIKPTGKYSLERLRNQGADHIELRNIDLNPYAYSGIDIRDLRFILIFILYEASRHAEKLSKERQIDSVSNLKTAAHYDLDINKILASNGISASLRESALALLSEIEKFYKELSTELEKSKVSEILDTISFQKSKVDGTGRRYAEMAFSDFGRDFLSQGLEKIS